MANRARQIRKDTVHSFDSFMGLPETWRQGFEKGHFSRQGQPPYNDAQVTWHVGWFDETLPAFMESNTGDVTFVHVDCDLYSSTDCIFRCIEHRLAKNAIIVFDELLRYKGFENHEFKAFCEMLKRTGRSFEILWCDVANYEQAVVRLD